ncbi:MAG TPA: DUF2000 domain-containing protein [Ktedonobacterales bacterium]|jgi:hypothetical protein
MDESSAKCVMVIDAQLPVGLAVNTAAVLALTLGSRMEALIGPDVADGSERVHVGITTLPIPILKADGEALKRLWAQATAGGDVFVVDFTDAAQTTRAYEDYTQKIRATPSEQLHYLGLALYGKREVVNRLTGSLPLLR